MDDCRFSRPYLESLSTQELTVLADTSGIDIPPGLERVFIIEELLDLENDDDPPPEGTEAPPLADAHYLEPVPLPKQYNITYINVLIRDPLWAFAFWEIKAADKETHEGAADFGGYYLKVVPLGKSGGDSPFTIAVGTVDKAWYLGFSPGGGRFRVELCVLRGEAELVLAVSPPFRLPKLLSPPGANRVEPALPRDDRERLYTPGLAVLSGLDDLRVLRNNDRLSRILRFNA
jgi:hypothetical protein